MLFIAIESLVFFDVIFFYSCVTGLYGWDWFVVKPLFFVCLRHTLWRCLQSAVTPVLASILEVIDRYSNLDLLCPGRLSPGLLQLWMDILADSQILNLTPPSNPRYGSF